MLEAAILTFVFLLPFPRTSGARTVALTIAIVLWVVRTRLFHQPIRSHGFWLHWLIAAYTGWVLLATVGSVDLVVSVKALRGDLSKFLLAYVLVIEVIRTPKQLERFFAATVLASTVVVAAGVASAWTPERVEGLAKWLPVYHNQNIIAGYLVVPTVVLAGLSIGATGMPRRALWMGLLVAHVAMLFASGSRTAVAAMVIALGVGALGVPRRRVALGASVLVLALGVGVASVSYDRAPAAFARYLSLFETATYQRVGGDSAMMTRQRIWAEAMDLSTTYPWAGYGYGIGLFSKVVRDSRNDVYQQLGAPPHAHNVWVQALFETGLIGLVLLAAVVTGVIARLLAALRHHRPRDERVIVVIALAGLTAVIMNSMTEAIYGAGVFGIQFWAFMGAGMSATLSRSALGAPAAATAPEPDATIVALVTGGTNLVQEGSGQSRARQTTGPQ